MIRRAIRSLTNAPRRERQYHVPRIVIARGPGLGRGEAVPTKCVIGRDSEADIVVRDPGVSERHASITLQGGAYVLQDLGSRNGTSLNGRSVRSAVLHDD